MIQIKEEYENMTKQSLEDDIKVIDRTLEIDSTVSSALFSVIQAKIIKEFFLNLLNIQVNEIKKLKEVKEFYFNRTILLFFHLEKREKTDSSDYEQPEISDRESNVSSSFHFSFNFYLFNKILGTRNNDTCKRF